MSEIIYYYEYSSSSSSSSSCCCCCSKIFEKNVKKYRNFRKNWDGFGMVWGWFWDGLGVFSGRFRTDFEKSKIWRSRIDKWSLNGPEMTHIWWIFGCIYIYIYISCSKSLIFHRIFSMMRPKMLFFLWFLGSLRIRANFAAPKCWESAASRGFSWVYFCVATASVCHPRVSCSSSSSSSSIYYHYYYYYYYYYYYNRGLWLL